MLFLTVNRFSRKHNSLPSRLGQRLRAKYGSQSTATGTTIRAAEARAKAAQDHSIGERAPDPIILHLSVRDCRRYRLYANLSSRRDLAIFLVVAESVYSLA
jgi:hypothetical protein